MFRRKLRSIPADSFPPALGVILLAVHVSFTSSLATANDAKLVALKVDRERIARFELNHVRFEDPELEVTEYVRIFPPGIRALWLKALEQDEVELQRKTADAIARAQRLGIKDTDKLASALLKLIEQPDLHPLVRLSVARALVELDERNAAARLADLADTSNLNFARVVEPALADWEYKPRIARWRAIAADQKETTPRRDLAIRCLGVVADADCLDNLESLLTNSRVTPTLRLQAARSVAKIDSDLALRLASPLHAVAQDEVAVSPATSLVNRLAAVLLLQTTDEDSGFELLERLVEDEEPTIAASAIQRLLSVAPDRVVTRSERLMQNEDANVRLLTAHCLAARPDTKLLPLLENGLSDPHPDVRRYARATLLDLASDETFEPLIRQAVRDVLSGDDWRGLEQAALLAGQLDEEPTADRLLELLDHQRPEVMLTAAWALRELAIDETLPLVFANAERKTEILKNPSPEQKPTPAELELQANYHPQLALMFEMFGRLEYQEAQPLLRTYVPKSPNFGFDARAAAVWSLGLLNQEQGDDELAAKLAERIADLNPLNPEADEVRRFSAVSLGRMKSKSQMKTLNTFYDMERSTTFVGRSCLWAISQITGQPMTDAGTFEVHHTGWFLSPLPPPKK